MTQENGGTTVGFVQMFDDDDDGDGGNNDDGKRRLRGWTMATMGDGAMVEDDVTMYDGGRRSGVLSNDTSNTAE